MASEWPRRTFGDLMSAGELEIGDGYRAKNDELATDGTGLIFLRAGHVTDSHIYFGGVERFINADDVGFGAKVSKVGDVIVTTKGNSTGRVAFVSQAMPRFVYSPHLSYWRATSKSSVRQDFLRAWSRSGEFVRQLHALSRSTDMAPYLSLRDQRRLEITIPPEHVQALIGQMADALNDRIELLRQTNVTLEAIAQAMFKSWFVDFDPVRAKAEGREPEGMDAATAALFPSEFEDSELGLIPKGWSIRSVGDLATITRGRSYKSSELADSDTALVTLKSFNRGGGFRRDGFKPYTGQFRPEQEVFEGDCIVAHTDVTQQAELIGRSAVVTRSPLYSRLVASLDVGIVRPKTDELTSIFLSALLGGDRYVSHIKGYTSGTTVLHLSKDGLPSFKFACPSPGLVKAYSDLAFAMFQRQATNIAIQESLAELRDTLLPRLISGKLRLPEAEKTVEESVA